jgi:hypothetical protein
MSSQSSIPKSLASINILLLNGINYTRLVSEVTSPMSGDDVG